MEKSHHFLEIKRYLKDFEFIIYFISYDLLSISWKFYSANKFSDDKFSDDHFSDHHISDESTKHTLFLTAIKCEFFPTRMEMYTFSYTLKKIHFFRHTAKIHFFQNLHNLPNLLYSCWLKNSTSFSTQQPQSRGARGSRTLTNPLVPKKVSSYEYQPPVRAMKPNLVSLGQVSVLILL
jgi:hypothetical protein